MSQFKITKTKLVATILALFVSFSLPLFASEGLTPETQEKEEVDMKKLIFGHIGDAYDWHITADILARCGLVSYVTMWNIIKPGDYLTFSSIKYTGCSDEPAVQDTIIWNIQSKGKYHIKVALDNGIEFTCLPCEFSQRIAKLTESHNNIMMNGKTIYSRIENIMPKANWIIYH
jgi:hypothetical protein